jgi:hypothetical protein
MFETLLEEQTNYPGNAVALQQVGPSGRRLDGAR